MLRWRTEVLFTGDRERVTASLVQGRLRFDAGFGNWGAYNGLTL